MPAVTSGKILVTGASGYIGAWIVKFLVEHNYTVLVALRTQSQIDFITKRFPSYEGKVTGIVVPVIEAPGAYDDAVKDVDGIIHAASPVVWTWESPSEIIDPAVSGATGILASAAKFGTKVKRVVLTSSGLAIAAEDAKEGDVHEESTWNTSSGRILAAEGKKTNPFTAYSASKALAEQAAWDFIQKEKPSFDLSTILPAYNFGPLIHEVSKEKPIASTPAMFLGTFPDGETSGKLVGDWVDARNSAKLHVLALLTPKAGGERITSTAGTYAWQDLYDVLNDAAFKNIPGKETYGAGKTKASTPTFSNAKSLKIFPDFTYHTLSETVKEMGNDLVASGLL